MNAPPSKKPASLPWARGYLVAGGVLLGGAAAGLLLVRAGLGDSPELMEQGWSLLVMFLSVPMASVGGTLILLGFVLPRLRADAEPPEPR